MTNALLRTVLVSMAVLAGLGGILGQDTSSSSVSDTQYERPFPADTAFLFEFSTDDGLNEISPGLAVKETSEEPTSSSESELGDLPVDSVVTEVSVVPTTAIDMETDTITVTMTVDTGIATVTVTDVVISTWSSGNADQSVTIPAQQLGPVIVTVTETYTSAVSNTVTQLTQVQVISLTTVVTETATQTTPSPVTSTVTESETTTETVTTTTTQAATTSISTEFSTSVFVDVESSYEVLTSYDIETRTFTLANGFLSYKTGFTEELWAPTYTEETTVMVTAYETIVVTV
ncbi:hypothetical protein EV175_003494 [Coemansia sp. RSA 1933]|nr:hypothetical protein EV175_003494 [Coemansia sp. RSA 1933]